MAAVHPGVGRRAVQRLGHLPGVLPARFVVVRQDVAGGPAQAAGIIALAPFARAHGGGGAAQAQGGQIVRVLFAFRDPDGVLRLDGLSHLWQPVQHQPGVHQVPLPASGVLGVRPALAEGFAAVLVAVAHRLKKQSSFLVGVGVNLFFYFASVILLFLGLRRGASLVLPSPLIGGPGGAHRAPVEGRVVPRVAVQVLLLEAQGGKDGFPVAPREAFHQDDALAVLVLPQLYVQAFRAVVVGRAAADVASLAVLPFPGRLQQRQKVLYSHIVHPSLCVGVSSAGPIHSFAAHAASILIRRNAEAILPRPHAGPILVRRMRGPS